MTDRDQDPDRFLADVAAIRRALAEIEPATALPEVNPLRDRDDDPTVPPNQPDEDPVSWGAFNNAFNQFFFNSGR